MSNFKRNISKRIFLLVCFFCTFILVIADNENYFFDQISLKEGLSQSTVKTIFRDNLGLLWIGTKDGLNRYDGSDIHTYHHDTKNCESLPDDNISFIVEDKNKTLWIGSSGALCRYNREKDTFIKEQIGGVEMSFQNVIVVDRFLYFTTPKDLYMYDCVLNKWSIKPFTGVNSNISLNCSMENWSNGNLIIGSRWSGLYICNPATGKLTKSTFFDGKLILDTYKDSKKRLWISQNGKGVFCFDSNGKKLYEVTPQNTQLPCDKVMSIIEYQGQVWMATDGNGIIIFSPDKNEFKLLTHNQNKPFSLPVNSILTIYTDQYSNLWLGSIRGGLIGVRKVYIQSYVNAFLNSSFGLSEKTVLSFYEDTKGIIWIGTDGEGINSYDPESQKFSHYSSTFGKKVSSITNYSEHELLLSFYKEGLAVFNKSTGRLSEFKLSNNTGNVLAWNGLLGINVVNTNEGSIFLSEEKVYKYSISGKKVALIAIDNKSEGAIRINQNPLDKNELVLYSTKVIRSLNIKTNAVRTVCEVSEPGMGPINSVDVDSSGKIWIGMSTGLYVLSNKQKLQQLCSNQLKAVSTLISDTKGYLWLGSGLELFRYNKKTGELINYGKAEGVNPNEYLPKSKLLSASGDIYIGGVEGFIRIHSNIAEKKDFKPNFELLNIQLNGTVFPIEKAENSNEVPVVNIPFDHNSLVINYFISTPDLGVSKHCRYTLKGLNTVYVDAPKQSISLQTLAPGDYTLQLSFEIKNNIWSHNIDLIQIHVKPPWWQTWWFYSIVLLLVAGALIIFKQNAVKNAKRSMEIEMQVKEKNLYEQKVKFLINISHELRTPLTLVYSPLRRMLKEDHSISDNLRPTLLMMYKHVKNIRNIINMVLDIRKLEVTHESLLISPHDVNFWIKSITDDFSLEFDARRINLCFELDESVSELNFDADKCEKVLSNLLMNALKFSEPNTTITIRTELDNDAVKFSVVDQGIGVAPEDEAQLFTRFYQGNHTKGGTGIGLSFSKTLIELHGGKIGYMPGTDNKGSIFWFTIPVGVERQDTQYTDAADFSNVSESDFSTKSDLFTFVDLQNSTVLLVEDEKELLDYLKDSLSKYFKKIITAGDGERGYTQIMNYHPDIVISDVMMPKMNGFELCKQIKTNVEVSHIPVILLTALGNDENILTGYKVGADMYIPKPFDVELLVTVISNLFKSRNEIKNRYKESNQHLLPEQITFSNADEQFLSKFIEKIELKMEDSEIDINWLAQEMAMGRTTFYAKMKAITGMSANAFIVDYKIKKAINLLTHTDLPILEIALMLGFTNQRYFSTVFKQNTGKTPTQYRNESSNNN